MYITTITLTCGLQYSSNQVNTQADNSAKLDTDTLALNDWNNVSIICWNCKRKTKQKESIHSGPNLEEEMTTNFSLSSISGLGPGNI